MLTRRHILSAGSAALAFTLPGRIAANPTRDDRFFASHDLPIGVQLFALAPDLQSDYAGTLRRLAAIGYKTVELASLAGPKPKELRSMLDATGLVCRSAHVMAQPVLPGPTLDDIDTVTRAAEIIGLTDIVMPLFLLPRGPASFAGPDPAKAICAISEELTVSDFQKTADFLNRTGHILKSRGLRLGYHNHNFEFAPKDGTTGYDVLLSSTDPKVVHFEMDVGWLAAAGQNPVSWLNRYAGRFTQMHVKDIKASTKPNFVLQQDPVEVGGGIIDWKKILPVAYSAGVRQYYIEEEAPFARPRMESIKMSFDYINKI